MRFFTVSFDFRENIFEQTFAGSSKVRHCFSSLFFDVEAWNKDKKTSGHFLKHTGFGFSEIRDKNPEKRKNTNFQHGFEVQVATLLLSTTSRVI